MREENIYRTGIYCRVSSEEKGKKGKYSNSIEAQIQMAEEYAASQKEIHQLQYYIDDGISGRTFSRPGFRKMLADILTGKINMIIVKDFSRLGREYIDTNYYIGKYFPEQSVRVVSLMDHYDSLLDPYDTQVELKTILNEMYVKNLSGKIKAAIRMKRKKGEYTAREAPFGYRKSKEMRNHLEKDSDASEIVRWIFHMYLQGSGYMAIARRLNENRIPSPATYKNGKNTDSGVWTASAIGRILKNRTYTGAVVISKEKQEWFANAHEAVISEEVFEKVQKIRETHQVLSFGKNKRPHKYAGVLFCGKCRNVMRKRYQPDGCRYDGYVCGWHLNMGKRYCNVNFISFSQLDTLVGYALMQQCNRQKEEIDQMKFQSQTENPENGIERVRMQIKSVCEREIRIFESFLDGKLSREAYEKEKEICKKKKKSYEIVWEKQKKDAEQRKIRKEEEIRQIEKIQNGIIPENTTGLQELIDQIFIFPEKKIEIFFQFGNY